MFGDDSAPCQCICQGLCCSRGVEMESNNGQPVLGVCTLATIGYYKGRKKKVTEKTVCWKSYWLPKCLRKIKPFSSYFRVTQNIQIISSGNYQKLKLKIYKSISFSWKLSLPGLFQQK